MHGLETVLYVATAVAAAISVVSAHVIAAPIVRMVRRLIANIRRLASGDLSLEGHGATHLGEVGDAADALRATVEALRGLISSVIRTSEAIGSQSAGLSSAATESSVTVEEVLAAVDQVSATGRIG